MKYRKKPVIIDAFQLNERGLVGEDWFWDAVSRNDIITHHFGKYHPEPDIFRETYEEMEV